VIEIGEQRETQNRSVTFRLAKYQIRIASYRYLEARLRNSKTVIRRINAS